MILNRQSGVRVAIRKLDEFAASARKLLKLPEHSLTICLVSNAEIARWNQVYRGKEGPTDVLSFPFEDEPQAIGARSRIKGQVNRKRSGQFRRTAVDRDDVRYLGDIAIAPVVARRNALRFGRTFDQEMRILIVHGMLHLMGYDHETDSGQMDRRERKLRRALKLE